MALNVLNQVIVDGNVENYYRITTHQTTPTKVHFEQKVEDGIQRNKLLLTLSYFCEFFVSHCILSSLLQSIILLLVTKGE